MLLLKLTLVPLFVLLVTLAARRWGPRVAGWLAGLPVVAGPILGFVAVEQGRSFGAEAAQAALAGVLGAVSFIVAYSRAAQQRRWPLALLAGFVAWVLATALAAALPAGLGWSAALAALALWGGPRLMPVVPPLAGGRPGDTFELLLRLVAGALLTLLTTWVAAPLGARWSGLLAVFPLMATVLAVFSHRREGADFVAAMLGSMITGLLAFAFFCGLLSLALARLPVLPAFGFALAACFFVQGLVGHRMRRRALARAA